MMLLLVLAGVLASLVSASLPPLPSYEGLHLVYADDFDSLNGAV